MCCLTLQQWFQKLPGWKTKHVLPDPRGQGLFPPSWCSLCYWLSALCGHAGPICRWKCSPRVQSDVGVYSRMGDRTSSAPCRVSWWENIHRKVNQQVVLHVSKGFIPHTYWVQGKEKARKLSPAFRRCHALWQVPGFRDKWDKVRALKMDRNWGWGLSDGRNTKASFPIKRCA